MRQREEEYLRLKSLVPRKGDAAGCTGKKELTLGRLRDWVRDLQARYGASERQIRALMGM